MTLELWPALLAGAVAGAVMEAARWLPAMAGRPLTLDFLHTWGSFLRMLQPRLRPAGLAFHLVLSTVVGLVYGLAFDLLGAHEDLWAWGLAAAAVHLSIAGFVVARIPITRRQAPGVHLQAGLFASALGERDTAAFVLTHLLYGLAVGVTYALAHPGGGFGTAF